MIDDLKLRNSAQELDHRLNIPLFVDPNVGFYAETDLKWATGEIIRVKCTWEIGAFIYEAILGQINPKTNQLDFITGPIASGASAQSVIMGIYEKLEELNKDVSNEPEESPEEQYINIMKDMDDLSLDPTHSHSELKDLSIQAAELESKLRVQGINPKSLLG